MRTLYLHNNRFAGSLPPSLGSLSSLDVLGLSQNLFTGALPPAFFAHPFSPVVDGSGRVLAPATVAQAVGSLVTVCPAGQTFVGASSASAGGGARVVVTAAFPVPICRTCAAGAIAPTPGSACIPCPQNTYSAGDGVACLPCPPGAVSSPGATSAAACGCPLGLQNVPANDSFSCVACSSGTSYDVSTLRCLPCTPGYSSPFGAKCIPVPPGFVSSPDFASFVPCGAGTYLNATTVSNPTCSPCPAGTTSGPAAAACAPCPSGAAALARFMFDPPPPLPPHYLICSKTHFPRVVRRCQRDVLRAVPRQHVLQRFFIVLRPVPARHRFIHRRRRVHSYASRLGGCLRGHGRTAAGRSGAGRGVVIQCVARRRNFCGARRGVAACAFLNDCIAANCGYRRCRARLRPYARRPPPPPRRHILPAAAAASADAASSSSAAAAPAAAAQPPHIVANVQFRGAICSPLGPWPFVPPLPKFDPPATVCVERPKRGGQHVGGASAAAGRQLLFAGRDIRYIDPRCGQLRWIHNSERRPGQRLGLRRRLAGRRQRGAPERAGACPRRRKPAVAVQRGQLGHRGWIQQPCGGCVQHRERVGWDDVCREQRAAGADAKRRHGVRCARASHALLRPFVLG